MRKRVSISLRTVLAWVTGLNQRERLFIGVLLVAALVILVRIPIVMIREDVEQTDRLVVLRKRHLEELSQLLKRYQFLNDRLRTVQKTFDESQMSFSEVFNELDRIVRDSIGSDNYDLKNNPSPERIGIDYEKQTFTLNVKSLTLEQLTRLLYRLEQGGSSLFIGKVDITKTLAKDFAATMEIFSIRKAEPTAA